MFCFDVCLWLVQYDSQSIFPTSSGLGAALLSDPHRAFLFFFKALMNSDLRFLSVVSTLPSFQVRNYPQRPPNNRFKVWLFMYYLVSVDAPTSSWVSLVPLPGPLNVDQPYLLLESSCYSHYYYRVWHFP